MTHGDSRSKSLRDLRKCPTGIRGLDEVTNGGLPRGRPTLICGAAGCGKTLLGMEFIVRGIRDFNEPGIFMSFEENEKELTENVASLGFDLADLQKRNLLAIDHVRVERSEIQETGEYDLEGLFVRISCAKKQIGAKRIVLDSLESLFAGLPNENILRAELRRLFRWLKDQGLTAVITAEQGRQSLTRHGLEEYVSDCVISLDHRVVNQVATRRLRVIKYRGSAHGTSEYPTMIDESGLSILPLSALGLDYPVSSERVSSGIKRLDTMLGGKGYYKGSSILVSGTAGAGKSSMAAAFSDSVCSRGRRTLYLSFEEAPGQILRNMGSIGMDLGKHVRKGLLEFRSMRSTFHGLEQHLVSIHKLVTQFKPAALVMDPVTNLTSIGSTEEIKAMLTRIIDYLKNQGITALFTSLTPGGEAFEQSEVGISSLMDTWLLLRMIESASERNRVLYILKSRGMAHSNQMREFVLSDKGIQLVDVYTGTGGVYTGTARMNQIAADQARAAGAANEAARKKRLSAQEAASTRAQMEALRVKLAGLAQEAELGKLAEQGRLAALTQERQEMARARGVD
ncbi:MAG: circadian clock protein KaiC [Elusimicrobia bacterium]|nr:circadian clock protein KaiC [Elusimicrobiota bacterium]